MWTEHMTHNSCTMVLGTRGSLADDDDTEDSTAESFQMLQVEDLLTTELNNIHIGHHHKSQEQQQHAFLRHLSNAGVYFQLEDGATIDDLIRLLKKWCLEGPYPITECVFQCHERGKMVCISNTIRTNSFVWKQLGLIMKEFLKKSSVGEEIRLVQMSPMYRYYGDLYPDNGRDSDFAGVYDVFDYC